MNIIDVSEISNKANIYNTDQEQGISRTSSHCERMILPISKQEESHILTMTDSRSRKHRLFQPYQSQKKNANFITKYREPIKNNENRITKGELLAKREDNRIPNNQDCIKSRLKITFKIPKITDYYIGEKLQSTAHRVNYTMRMNSLINPKSLLQPQEEKEEKKEMEFATPPMQMKSLRQLKLKDASKQKKQVQSYAMWERLKISQNMAVYVVISLAVLGFMLHMLLH